MTEVDEESALVAADGIVDPDFGYVVGREPDAKAATIAHMGPLERVLLFGGHFAEVTEQHSANRLVDRETKLGLLEVIGRPTEPTVVVAPKLVCAAQAELIEVGRLAENMPAGN